MASTHKSLRSGTANKRPTTSIADGQIALNTNTTSPGLFFKDSTGASIIKVGPVHVGTTAPNASPAAGGSSGNSTGEVWLDTSLTPVGVKIWNGSAWVNATPIGSTTVQGLLELATDAETQAGSDTARAVTPASLQSKVSDSTSTTSSTTIASSTAVKSAYDLANAALPKSGGTITGNLEIGTTGSLSFEGATADAFETTIAVTDPTADRTITLPDVTGTVVTTGDTGTVTSTMLLDGTIVDGDINASAAIAHSKLANITAGSVLLGNASNVPTATALSGDVTINSSGVTAISSGVIVDADINASAAIADTKLATIATADKVSLSALNIDGGTDIGAALADADLFIVDDGGAGTNRKAAATRITDYAFGKVSGDITIGSTGTAAISSGVIVNADVNASAAIAGTKISPDFGSQTVATTGLVSTGTGTAGAPTITFTGDTNTGIYSPGADQVAISTNGSGRLFVDSSGRVGIGAAPSAIFHITQSAADAVARIDGGSSNTAFVDFRIAGSNKAYVGLGGLTGGSNNDLINYNSSAGNWIAYTNGSERMRLTSTGLLGLGTSSPNVGLTISSQAVSTGAVIPNADIAFPSAYANGFFRALGNYNQGAGVGGTIQLGGKSYTDSGFVGAFLISAVSGGNATDALTFSTQTSFNNVVSERMRLDSSGRLGIGTTSPSTKLDVTGGSIGINNTNGVTGEIVFNQSGQEAWFIGSQASSRDLTIRQFNGGLYSERARIDSSGRLLVGTSTSQSPFNTPLQVISSGAQALFARKADNSFGPVCYFAKYRGTDTTVLQNNDDLGSIQFWGADSSSVTLGASIGAFVDGTPGANDMPGRLVFSTTADGASSPTERMRITNAGGVRLPDVYNATIALSANVFIDTDGTLKRATSSIKYKTDVETLQDSYADAILNCRPVWYRSTNESDNPTWGWWGFIAEEVAEIDPRLVQWKTVEQVINEDGSRDTVPLETPEPENVAYDRFVPHLLNLIKRQGEALAELQTEVAALKGA
jgi:hypothetical protein